MLPIACQILAQNTGKTLSLNQEIHAILLAILLSLDVNLVEFSALLNVLLNLLHLYLLGRLVNCVESLIRILECVLLRLDSHINIGLNGNISLRHILLELSSLARLHHGLFLDLEVLNLLFICLCM